MAETGTRADGAPSASTGAGRLFAIVRELAIELEPGRRETLEVTPDSILDRDLGIDSLARLELSLRIERGFGVRLAEQALMEAVTPADLLAALEAAHPEEAAAMLRAVAEPVTGTAKPAPATTQTLVEMLAFHADTHPDRTAIRLLSSDADEEAFSYRVLWDSAQTVAAGLREERLAPGDAVAIMLPTGAEFFHAFLGALLAGCRSDADLSTAAPCADRGPLAAPGRYPAQCAGACSDRIKGNSVVRPHRPGAGAGFASCGDGGRVAPDGGRRGASYDAQ